MIFYLAVILGLLSAYLVLSAFKPLTEGAVLTAEEWERLEDETLYLLRRRDRVFAEIRELEFESALNKVDPVEFANMRRRYEDEALAIMSELQAALDTYGTRIDGDIDAVLDAAAAKRTVQSASAEATEVAGAVEESRSDESQAEAIIEKRSEEPLSEMDCGQCGARISSDSLFCDHCGAKQVLTCPACDHENRLGANFCKACGCSLQSGEPS